MYTAAKSNNSVNFISLQQIHTVYCCGLTIGIGAIRDNSSHRKIREILLVRTGAHRCPGLSNQCTFLLVNKQAGEYISAAELELNRSRHFPLGEIVWYLSTQANDSDIAA